MKLFKLLLIALLFVGCGKDDDLPLSNLERDLSGTYAGLEQRTHADTGEITFRNHSVSIQKVNNAYLVLGYDPAWTIPLSGKGSFTYDQRTDCDQLCSGSSTYLMVKTTIEIKGDIMYFEAITDDYLYSTGEKIPRDVRVGEFKKQ